MKLESPGFIRGECQFTIQFTELENPEFETISAQFTVDTEAEFGTIEQTEPNLTTFANFMTFGDPTIRVAGGDSLFVAGVSNPNPDTIQVENQPDADILRITGIFSDFLPGIIIAGGIQNQLIEIELPFPPDTFDDSPSLDELASLGTLTSLSTNN